MEKTVTCALNGGTENSLSEKSVGAGLLKERRHPGRGLKEELTGKRRGVVVGWNAGRYKAVKRPDDRDRILMSMWSWLFAL